MFILGISALGHDSAAALFDGRSCVAAIEEAKVTRSRSVRGIPRAAIQFCLDQARISWRDVEIVGVATSPGRAFSRQAALRLRLMPLAPVTSSYYLNRAFGDFGRELNNFRILRLLAEGGPGRVIALDHHLSHAASAFFASPFDPALIVTLDENGDGRAGLVSIGEGPRIREVSSLRFPDSLAWVYSQITTLLGFRPHADEHKTQWLSLSGEPVFADLFLDMLRRAPAGPPRLNPRYFQRGFGGVLAFSGEFCRRVRIPHDNEPRVADPLRANLAASLEQACETILVDWLESLRARTQQQALCLAGGLFLNPLLVAAIERKTGFDKIFVQPAAGNEGTSLGAAYLLHHQKGLPRLDPMPAPYWGPSFSNEAIKQVLDNCKAPYGWCDSEDRKIGEAIQLLRAGKIIAWFQGAAEFGPRALGNRSLIASPWAPYAKENLNDFVKHRESFRPFALAIPAEDCADYFDCSANARFLTTMAVANPKARKLFDDPASGFVSKNGLVRLHAVSFDDNPLLWKLLKRWGEVAPAPMLVNTSFNLFGEPLVVTPRDAVRSFYCSGVDALVAGSFLLRKR